MTDSTTVAIQLGAAIDTVSSKLKVPSQFVWQVLKRQAVIQIVPDVLALIAFGMLTYFGMQAVRRAQKADNENETVQVTDIILCVAGVASAIGTLIFAIGTIVDVGYLMNPDYFALKQIFDVAKGR